MCIFIILSRGGYDFGCFRMGKDESGGGFDAPVGAIHFRRCMLYA